ncbi:MAG: protoporphyrinogen/coproporphyrinogen oxidase [Thermodesulfobacteriota bacterium]
MGERIVILGAGVSGLSVAYHLDRPALLYEAALEPGGMCRTVKAGDYLLDMGVHTLFTSDPYVSSLYERLLEGRLNSQQSVAQIHHDGRYVDFPLQTNLWQLPARSRRLFLEGVRKERERVRVVRNYQDWLVSSFGQPMAEAFMIPYNRKKYGVDLALLDAAPFAAKNPVPSLEEMEAGAQGPLRRSYGHNPRWRYPSQGGFQALVNSLVGHISKDIRISCGIQATSISCLRRTLVLAEGTEEPYDLLVSTIPLDRLVAMIHGLPEDLKSKTKGLSHKGIRIISFGVAGPPTVTFHWAYYADPDIPFLRLSIPSRFAQDLAPPGHHLIQAEVTDDGADMESVEDALVKVRALRDKRSVVFRHSMVIPHAYPHQALGQRPALERLLAGLGNYGIHCLGRLGTWSYLDADQCILQGKRVAQAVLAHGVPHLA